MPTEARPMWSLDHERTWLASRLADRATNEEKDAFMRGYMTSLTRRYTSFDGLGVMEECEYQDMLTFCLRVLYEMEKHSE